MTSAASKASAASASSNAVKEVAAERAASASARVPVGVDGGGHRRALGPPVDGVVVPSGDRPAPHQPHA